MGFDVTHDMHAFVILDGDQDSIRLTSRWSWSRADPAVVTVVFGHPNYVESATVRMSRENLVTAAIGRVSAGMGDCVIEPRKGIVAGEMLLFHLASFTEDGIRMPGHQHILVSGHSVKRMLSLTLEIVPQEFEVYDIDSVIERILK